MQEADLEGNNPEPNETEEEAEQEDEDFAPIEPGRRSKSVSRAVVASVNAASASLFRLSNEALFGGRAFVGVRTSSSPVRALLRGQTLQTMPGEEETPVHPLHLRVDPSYWCVNRADLVVFEREVYELWTAKGIPDNLEVPNAGHRDLHVGPTIYQVNKHYIRPRTRAAGGMSWALMRHPEGLKCDIFVSHCWAEGVFEFLNKVRRMWPVHAMHLWCCFLANPQNADIGSLLGAKPSSSPFARALRSADCVLVVPNGRVSVYTRLWCVYEAHMAIGLELEIMLPMRPEKTAIMHEGMPLAMLGIGMYTLARLAPIGMVPSNEHYVRLDHPWLALIYLCPAWLLLGGGVLGRRFPRLFMVVTVAMVALRAGAKAKSEVGMLSWEVCAVVALPQVFNLLALVEFGYHLMMTKCLEDEGNQLNFSTVKDGICSNLNDERAIRSSIAGYEEEIDAMVRHLRVIGKCNSAVKANLDRGMRPIRIQEGVLAFGAAAGAMYWVESIWLIRKNGSCIHKLMHISGYEAMQMFTAELFGFLLVLVACCIFGQHFIFASDALMLSGIVCIIGVIFGEQALVPGHRTQFGVVFVSIVGLVALAACCRFYGRRRQTMGRRLTWQDSLCAWGTSGEAATFDVESEGSAGSERSDSGGSAQSNSSQSCDLGCLGKDSEEGGRRLQLGTS